MLLGELTVLFLVDTACLFDPDSVGVLRLGHTADDDSIILLLHIGILFDF